MALCMARQCLHNGNLVSIGVRLMPASIQATKIRSMQTKQFRQHIVKPKPFPYEQIKFGWWRAIFDDTESRFDENTRIIVVDGNVATGKHELAKKIAEEFDLVHFPAATMDFALIDDSGFDERSIEDKYPEICRPMDVNKFLANPSGPMVPDFQYTMYGLRLEQYFDAMAHVLHTGQGVVMERSVYSDFVFMEALHRFKYVKDNDLEIYNKIKTRIAQIPIIFKPHLIVYLEASPESILQKIKERGDPNELNTKVYTPEFFNYIDETYKQKYLREEKDTSEILIYDCTEPIDPEIVIEDIERVPFDKPMADNRDSKFKDWKQLTPGEFNDIRINVTNMKEYWYTMCFNTVIRYNTLDLIAGYERMNEYIAAREKYGPVCEELYDPTRTGSNYLFQLDTDYRKNGRIFYRTR